MLLQIYNDKAKEWRTLRTAEETGKAAYNYLHQQMDEWRQNCDDFRASQFRIGSFKGYGETETFEEYDAATA